MSAMSNLDRLLSTRTFGSGYHNATVSSQDLSTSIGLWWSYRMMWKRYTGSTGSGKKIDWTWQMHNPAKGWTRHGIYGLLPGEG